MRQTSLQKRSSISTLSATATYTLCNNAFYSSASAISPEQHPPYNAAHTLASREYYRRKKSVPCTLLSYLHKGLALATLAHSPDTAHCHQRCQSDHCIFTKRRDSCRVCNWCCVNSERDIIIRTKRRT